MTTVKFFGEKTGSLLFEMKFETGYSHKKYQAILRQIQVHSAEIRDLFGEPVKHILVEKDRPHRRAEKGMLYGAEVSIFKTGYNHIASVLTGLSEAVSDSSSTSPVSGEVMKRGTAKKAV